MTAVDRESVKALVSNRVRALLAKGERNPLVTPADSRPWRIGGWMQGEFPVRRRRRPGVFAALAEYEGVQAAL